MDEKIMKWLHKLNDKQHFELILLSMLVLLKVFINYEVAALDRSECCQRVPEYVYMNVA